MTLKRFLRNLIWAGMLPPILLALFLAVDAIYTLDQRKDDHADDLAENVAEAIDREILRYESTLQVLAASPFLDPPAALDRFYETAVAYHSQLGPHVVLADTSMQMLMNSRVPFWTPLPRLPVPKGHAAAPTALKTRKPDTGDMFFGPVANQTLVVVAVPVLRRDEVTHLLLAVVDTAHYQKAVDALHIPEGWSIAIRDSQGAVIASRGVPETAPVGLSGPDNNSFHAATLRKAPWSVTVYHSGDWLSPPTGQFAAVLAGMILSGLLIGGVFAGRAARELTRAVDSLIEPAATPGAGSRIHEIEAARAQILSAAAAQKAAESEVLESEARFRSVIDQSLAGVAIVQNDAYVYVNPGFAALVGYRPEDLIGASPRRLFRPDDLLNLEGIHRRLSSGEEASTLFTMPAVCKDGTQVILGIHCTPIVYGHEAALLSVATDVTERRRQQEAREAYTASLEAAMLGTVTAVTRVMDYRDPYTAGHERRVGAISRAIGEEMGLPEETLKGLEIAGLVHDIGKISVPAEILAKPTRLTDDEFGIVKGHALTGYQILNDVKFSWPVAEVALQHHERLDGTGYPSGLRGDDICLEARITAVADVIEAIATHRPYRPALGLDAALDEIEQHNGTAYDERVVAAALRLFRDKGFQLPA
jgi:PAS domain S-box-containing protein